MKLVNQKLGLNPEASETAAAEAVQKIIDRAETAEAKAKTVSDKEKEIEKLKNEKKDLEAEVKKTKKTAVESFVDAQIEAGRFKEENRDKLVDQAEKDFDGFKELCESLNGNFVDVTSKLGDGDKKGTKKPNTEKLMNQAKEYHEADVKGELSAFKNKVGEKEFEKIEDFYVENMEKVIEAD